MAFLNVQIESDDLPKATDLVMEPMAPAYLREVKVQQAITWAILLLISLIPYLIVVKPEGLKTGLMLIPIGMLVLASLLVPLVVKQAKVRAIALREHDVAYRSGVFFRKIVMLAFNRVQHIELSSGPLQRRYGLASLKFFTAGGSSVDLQVDGLTLERAEELREFIISRGGSNQS